MLVDNALKSSNVYETRMEYEEAVINAKIFANEFHEISKCFTPSFKKANKGVYAQKLKCNTKILDLLSRIRFSVSRGRCHGNTFKQQMLKINIRQPMDVELWWYMMKCDLMSRVDLHVVFESPKYTKIAEHILNCLFRNIFIESEHTSAVIQNVNSDFIEHLLEFKLKCDSSKTNCEVYNNFMKLIAQAGIEGNETKGLNICHLVGALKTSTDSSVIKLFLLDVIESFLKGKSLPLEYLLYQNEYYAQNPKFEGATGFVDIFTFLTSNEIISLLKQILMKTSIPIHWLNLFDLLSCLSSHNEDASKEIKNLTRCLLDEALKTQSKTLLLHMFILARYCSFSKMVNFPTYVQWFSSTFSGESSRPLNTKEKALFFIEFLSEFVKHDSAYCLKVHINRAPCLPMDCQMLLSDYVRLAKTRLSELNESFELGLFENLSKKNFVEHDIETVLSLFAVNNEIPKCLLEASFFCKPYYEKKFLVELLAKFEGKNSLRHKLVMKLNSLGKIPNSLFLSYKNKF